MEVEAGDPAALGLGRPSGGQNGWIGWSKPEHCHPPAGLGSCPGGKIATSNRPLAAVKKKGCDSFKRFLPDVYRTVNSIARFRPIYFANTDFPRLSFSSIAELNFEQVPVQHHGHPMKGITMLRCRLPGRKSYSPDLVISAMMQYLLIRRQFHD